MNSSTSNFDRPAIFKSYLAVYWSLLIVLIIVFVVASEILIRTKVAPNINIEEHAAYLRTSERNSAAFGDSHVAMGITGTDRFANLAYPANSLGQIIGKARLYFDRVQPEYVILQADPQQLVPGRLAESFENERSLFEKDSNLSNILKVSIPIYRRSILNYWKAFLTGVPFKRIRVFDPEDGSQTATGSIADWDDARIRDFSNTVNYDTQFVEVDPNHPVLREFENLTAWLTNKGAQLCFVAFPVDHIFYTVAKSYPLEEASRQYYRQLADRYGAKFIDYRSEIFTREFLFDPDHLNRRGGEMFTRRAVQDCFGN
jgi:hypothetical protein